MLEMDELPISKIDLGNKHKLVNFAKFASSRDALYHIEQTTYDAESVAVMCSLEPLESSMSYRSTEQGKWETKTRTTHEYPGKTFA